MYTRTLTHMDVYICMLIKVSTYAKVYMYLCVCCVRAFIHACVCEIYSPNYGFMHVYSKDDLKN